jgi:predicted phosphohydrolase
MSAMSLNAMEPDAEQYVTRWHAMVPNAMMPDVTRWQEICKNPEEEQKLTKIYEKFCQKRVNDCNVWVLGGWTSFTLAMTLQAPIAVGISGLFALRQTYLLGRNRYRNSLALKKDLSYLNHDVLEQLGYPPVSEGDTSFKTWTYRDSRISKCALGMYIWDKEPIKDDLSVDNVEGIEKALSGCYNARDCQESLY